MNFNSAGLNGRWVEEKVPAAKPRGEDRAAGQSCALLRFYREADNAYARKELRVVVEVRTRVEESTRC